MLPLARTALMGSLLLLASSVAVAQAPPDLLATIRALDCDLEKGGVRVSFRLEGAMGAEVQSSLEAGLPITFTHEVSVRRRGFLWFQRTLGQRKIAVSAKLDTLTRQYTLSRSIDDGPAETRSTDSRAEMERWMVEVRNLAIPAARRAGSSVYARVSSAYRTDFLLFLLPRSLSAVGDAECR